MATYRIEEGDHHQVLATAGPADDQDRVLKHGETFAVMNRYGDIRPVGLGEEGVYHEGTRFVSRWELRLGRLQRPLLLSSHIKENNILLSVDVTNPDSVEDGNVVPRGSLHMNRSKFLWQGVYYERITLWNLSLEPVDVGFSLYWEADFVDLFEVRGHERKRRGELFQPSVTDRSVVFQYRGLDEILRRARIECTPTPATIGAESGEFAASLGPKEIAVFHVSVACQVGETATPILEYDEALLRHEGSYEARFSSDTSLFTSNQQLDYFLERSHSDLRMMISQTDLGPYPYAGIPWYSTIFGRDGIITAHEMLWLNPEIAKGVLLFLAQHQATDFDPAKDAEPGKILHEMRLGELANLGEIPFGRYYGSVDSTPLFVILAGEYHERTADLEILQRLWPHVERALDWIDGYGDPDGDGYVEYSRRTEHGLTNQGWKDSHDSVFHADGSLAKTPIALCEVQAYVYEARSKAARMAAALGYHERSRRLDAQASELREKFLRDFWMPELGCYALALDADKKPCRVRTSNAGHCLFSGIATPAHAKELAGLLMNREMYSGWGIRTVSTREVRYSPVSYHNGTIWPHDNAMIAYGMARYGFKDETAKLLSAFLDVSRFVEFDRLPELFCGFERQPSLAPTLYPVACKPQAWASASIFMLIQACLGIVIDGKEEKLYLSTPVLPESIRELGVKNLRIGKSLVDLKFHAVGEDVVVNVLRQTGDLQIIISKIGRRRPRA